MRCQSSLGRRGTLVIAALLLCLWTAVSHSCVQDVGDAVSSRAVRPVAARYDDAGLGLDPGLEPVLPLRDAAVAGASIPGPENDLLVAFVAFVSAAPADDADGLGNPLDRSSPAATDTNGSDDVFLAAVVDPGTAISGRPTPAAFTQGIAAVMRDERCVRCHSFHYPGGWREDGHVGNIPAGTNECGECHLPQDILRPGVEPATISWVAPDLEQVEDPSQDFRGKSDDELFELVLSRSDPAAHLRLDDKIQWAVAHGLVPFRGEADGGRVPMDPQQWQDLVDAWELGGMQFSTDGAVHDVALVSRRAPAFGGAVTGNGGSGAPVLAYTENPAFSPANPTAARVGSVWIAFPSAATDLVAGGSGPHRNVFRARVDVHVDAAGRIDLRFVAGATELASRASGGGGGDGDSDEPAISGDGRFVAFRSLATDLVAGFADNNGADRGDVFLTDFAAPTELLSRAGGAAAAGANGDSGAPALGAGGDAVAFASDAFDLLPGDTNGVRDVFLVDRAGGPPALQRVSVRSGGGQGTGGDSDRPSLWREGATGATWVAFESAKTDLAPAGARPQVYVHEVASAGTVRLGNGRAAAQGPQIGADGRRLLFSTAGAVDTVRADGNGLQDVVSLDFAALRATGGQRFERLSVGVTGADADGASERPRLAPLRNLAGGFQADAVAVFRTEARNLGRSPNSELVVQFLVDRQTPRTRAEFQGEPRSGTAPLTVRFTDLSSNAATWTWDFGDGQGSSEQNPQHVYATGGSFDVTLVVTGPTGTSTRRRPDFVTVQAAAKPWSQIYDENSFAATCGTTSCHSLGRTSPRFSMASAGIAYDNLVGVPSVRLCAQTNRVTPNDLGASTLLDAVSSSPACVSFRMGSLGAQAIQDLRDWIEAGAPR